MHGITFKYRLVDCRNISTFAISLGTVHEPTMELSGKLSASSKRFDEANSATRIDEEHGVTVKLLFTCVQDEGAGQNLLVLSEGVKVGKETAEQLKKKNFILNKIGNVRSIIDGVGDHIKDVSNGLIINIRLLNGDIDTPCSWAILFCFAALRRCKRVLV